MKIKLFASAAVAAAVFAAPAFAGEPTGYIDAGLSNYKINAMGDSEDSNAYSLGGAVAFDAPCAWSVQIDGRYTNLWDDELDQFGATAHVFRRGEQGMIGGFVGVRESFAETSTWATGLEGAYYGEKATLSGALGYGQVDELEGEVWAARGGVAVFATDNLRFDGGIEWNNVEVGGEEFRMFNYGVSTEYQLDAMPFSVFAGWEHTKFEEDGIIAMFGPMADGFSTDTLKLGVRYNFGADSLKARDRSGASLGELGGLFKGGFPFF